MKRVRLGTWAVSVLAAAGLALGLSASASATTARPATIARPASPTSARPAAASGPASTSVRQVVFDCAGQPQALVKPRNFILTCADANSVLGKLSWTSWTPGRASATGLLEENDCNPYCAVGHFHSFPAVVIFRGSAAVKNHPGERCYTKMTIILTGPRPRYYDYLTHKSVTAPVTQTSALITAP
jgi:hypothetical protein